MNKEGESSIVKILVYINKAGGATIRILNVIKRGLRFGVKYFVVFPDKNTLEELPFSITYYIKLILNSLISGLKIVLLEKDVRLIYAGVDSFPCILLAYVTHLISGKPWTTIIQSVPVYGHILTYYRERRYFLKSGYRDFYRHFRQSKGLNVFYAIIATMLSILIVSILKRSKALIVARSIFVKPLNEILGRVSLPYVVLENDRGVDIESIDKINPQTKKFDGIFVAVRKPERGLFEVIRIWEYVVNDLPKAKLGICGYVVLPNGRLKTTINELISLIKEKNLEKNVTIIGNLQTPLSQRELWEYLKSAKILLYPSAVNGGGLLLLEALACGLPIVAYENTVLMESLPRNPIIFSPSYNRKKFAKTIVLLLRDERQLTMYSKKAYNYAKQFNYDKVMLSEKKAYKQVLLKWLG